jgi:hypothetical protein
LGGASSATPQTGQRRAFHLASQGTGARVKAVVPTARRPASTGIRQWSISAQTFALPSFTTAVVAHRTAPLRRKPPASIRGATRASGVVTVADIGSLDYDLKRDVSALCAMVEDDYPEESIYHRYGVILSTLSELVMIGRRAKKEVAADHG